MNGNSLGVVFFLFWPCGKWFFLHASLAEFQSEPGLGSTVTAEVPFRPAA